MREREWNKQREMGEGDRKWEIVRPWKRERSQFLQLAADSVPVPAILPFQADNWQDKIQPAPTWCKSCPRMSVSPGTLPSLPGDLSGQMWGWPFSATLRANRSNQSSGDFPIQVPELFLRLDLKKKKKIQRNKRRNSYFLTKRLF